MVDLGRIYNIDEIFDPDAHLPPGYVPGDDHDCDDDYFDDIEVSPPSNLEVALSLAQAGLFVHPCNANKAPMVAWGTEADRRGVGSSCNPSVVDAWWRVMPTAIPGVNTGKCRLIVVDCDRHGGQNDGVTAFWDLAAGHGGIPEGCPIVTTPSEGRHVYFALPDGFMHGNSSGRLPPGIDIRGVGGQVIAPGAALPDGRRWQRAEGAPDLGEAFAAGTIPVLPGWLADIIRASKQREVAPEETTRQLAPQARETTSGERFRSYALAALDGIAADLSATGEGGRNTALNNGALRLGSMAARGWLTRSEVHSALHSACVTNGYLKSDGRSAFEKTFASGFGAGLRKPANDPADGEQWLDSAEIAALAEEIGRKVDEATDGDAETGEVIEAQRPAQKPMTLNIVNAASLAGLPVPERRWLVQDMIPEAKVTLLYGDGGSGKSLLAIQLADAVATGGEWLGEYVERGRVLYVSCEDDIDEQSWLRLFEQRPAEVKWIPAGLC